MKDAHGGNIWEAARKAGLSPGRIIDFSASINPAGLGPRAKEAVRKALSIIPAYPDPSGLELKKALASYHGISVGQVLPANGSTELVFLIPQVLKPKKALIVEPAFSEYRRALFIAGCRVKSLVLREKDGFLLEGARLKKALSKGRVDVVYIGNPSNPTGALVKKETLCDIAAFCEKAGTNLVVDEAFMDFCEAGSLKAEASRFKNLLILRSMTKFFGMAGLRSGALVAHKSVIERFSRGIAPWSVNTLAGAASIASLKDGHYIRKTRQWLQREKGFLLKGLCGVKGLKVFPSEANFFMFRIDGRMRASHLRARLLKKGILIRDLTGFRGLGPGYCRVAVKERKDNRALVEAINEVFS